MHPPGPWASAERKARRGSILNSLGRLCGAMGRTEDGLAAHRKAIALRERNAQSGDEQHLAELLERMGRADEANASKVELEAFES